MTDEFEWFLGIDWGSEVHALCLLDATGRIRGTRTVAHTVGAIHDALHWVREQTGAASAAIAVGIETPRGALVDTVIEQGFPVFASRPRGPKTTPATRRSWPMPCAPTAAPFDGSAPTTR